MTDLRKVIGDKTRGLEKFVKDVSPEEYSIIANSSGKNFPEKLYRYLNPNEDTKCYCGNDLKLKSFREGFREYCGIRCAVNSPDVKDKISKTVMDRYGSDHYSKTADYRKKYEKTCMDRYGVKNAGASSKIVEMKSERKRETFLLKMCEESNLSPLFSIEEYSGVRDEDGRSRSYEFKCNICDNVFCQTVLGGVSCPVCYPRSQYGSPSISENEIADWLSDLGIELVRNSRSIIPPKEIDIYLPLNKIAIEYCGNYWHSDLNVENDSHLKKLEMCEERGIRLLTIFEDEWREMRDIVKARILSRLGKINRLAVARKCDVKEISSADYREFVKAHHLQGYAPARVKLGLFFGDILVAVMSFSRGRYWKEDSWEMIRFCSAGSVPGAAAKLFSYFRKDRNGEICYSYADRRFSQGDIYEILGFSHISTTKPNYSYIDITDTRLRHHRLNFTKKNLVKQGYDRNLTEQEIMIGRKFARVYDCGSHLYRIKM